MSNRSFHLANRFQTMISAIRAAPLRVLFLAVAVVGLMTVTDLTPASPVHAQEQAVTATRDATGESPPARPTDLQASAGPDSVSLTWTASTDQTVTHYAVLLRDRDKADAGVFKVIDSNAGSATSYTDRSVSPGGSYVYRVKAVSPTGVSQWSSYARADIPADPEDLAPSGLSAKAVFDGGDSAGVALNWVAPAADAESVTGYEILRAVGDGDLATLVADTGSADTTYADHTATKAGESYAYRVKALRGEETSQPSDRAEASIPKVTALPVEPRIAEEQSGTTAWVSNTAQTVAPAVRIILGNTNKRHSQGFRTGAESGGYSLGSVGVYVDDEDLESGETFTVHIYTASAVGAIDTLVHTLTSPDSYADDAVNLFTAPADATLAANTDYLVVFEATGNAANDFALGYTVSTSEDSGSATGWSIEDERRFDNSTFNGILVISVNAAAEESAVVWSATLTVAELVPGSTSGCSYSTTGKECSTLLDDDDFTYNGNDYQIVLLISESGILNIEFAAAPGDDVYSFELNAGGSIFSFQSATAFTTTFFYVALQGFAPWTVGDTVSLSITVSSPAAAPAVSSVDVTSDPGGDDTYAIGDTVQVTVTFDQAVTVTGAPRIQLRIGGGNSEHFRWADYTSGSGNEALLFSYTVEAGDFDDDGIDIAADELELNGGTIQSSGGTDANLDYPDQGGQSGHKVDGVRPTPEFAMTSADGNSIFVIFSEPLSATTAPANAFTLSVDTGTAPTISTATASGNSVTLGLAGALTSDQVVTVAYVDATSGNDAAAVQDAAGNDAANFTTGEGDAPAVSNAVGTGCSIVAGCYLVSADWGLIPSGLGAGAEFRLLFVSSVKRNAQSTDIADYNTFVQTAAAGGHTDIQQYSSTIRVLGSTADVDARDNTATTYTADDKGVAIYWLGGAQVAGDYEDFYDGSWSNGGAGKDENGAANESPKITTLSGVYTGSSSDGTENTESVNSVPVSRGLGTEEVRISNPALTTSFKINSPWLNGPFYGLSGVFRVSGQVVTNTAPAFSSAASFSTNEHQAATFQVTAMDADAGDEVSYAITGGADLAVFGINVTSGLLVLPTGFDHENPSDADSNNVYLVTVTATGGTGARALTTDQAINVTVNDVDEPPSAPAAPTVSAVSGTTDSLSVTWTAPDNRGRPAIQSYNLQYRKGTTGNFADGPQDVTGLTDTITGLDAGSAYQVQVRATNDEGDSAWSTAGSGSTNALAGCGTLPTDRLWSACLTVGEINAAGRYGYQASDSTGSLAPATFDIDTTTYTVSQFFDNDLGGTYVQITLAPAISEDDASNLTLHIGDDTSLSFGDANYSTPSSGSTHQWSRTAVLGWSTGDAIVVGITQEEQVNTAPAFTTSAAFSTDENQRGTFQVTAMDDDAGDEVSYAVTGGADLAHFQINATTGLLAIPFTLDHENPEDADSNNVYLVTVTATGGTGARALTTDQAITVTVLDVDEPPSAPATPTVSAVNGTSDRLSVSWTRPDDTGIPFNFSYDLQYRKGTIGDFTDGPQNVIGLTATIHGLDADSAYQVRVRATNDEGDSGWSSAGSGTTYAQTPPPDAYFLTGPAFGTYAIDGTLSFTVDFSAAVTVSGTPQLALDIGGETRQADYASGSGTESLLFSYTVAEDDEDTEGIGVPADSLTLNGGAITAITADGLAATLSLSRFSLGGVLVDGVRPIPEFAATSVDGNSIIIIFSETLSATTAPASAFTLSVDTGTAPTVSTATASGDKVTLALASALTSGQAVTVAYIDPTLGNDAAAVQDAVGNDAVSFTTGEGDVPAVANAVGTGCSLVDGCYVVSADWGLIPTGLGAGAEFRLLFRTSGTRNAASTDIADYNTFVQTAAGGGHADIQQYSSTIRVLGSTAAVDARDNTVTTYTADDKGVAIYWLGGAKVADDYEDFYDGSWSNGDAGKDEHGADRAPEAIFLQAVGTFTGSVPNGTEAATGLGASRGLGASSVRLGEPFSGSTSVSNANLGPFYGLSGVFRVSGQVVTNTAPAFSSAASFSTNEHQAATFQVTAMDADAGDEVTYAITGGADLALFQINATNGQLAFPTPYDHENPADADGNNVYLVTVTATGGTGARALTTDQAINVTVNDVDEPPSAPAAPTVSAVSGTTDSLSVTWTAPDNRGRPAIQSYNLQYRKGTTGNFADGPQDVTGLTDTITGLDAGSAYQVQVRATNDEGDSFWSQSGSGTTNEPTDPTDADNLTATAHTGKIRLGWTGSADAYEFRRKEDGGAWSAWTAAETRGWFVLRNATTLDDYDVLALTEYTYQVRVAGDAGNLGEDSATLGPPITLRLGATEYRVDEGAGELFFTVLAETPVGLGRYDRDIRPSFTSAGVVGPLPEGPLVKTQEDYELLIESLRIEPGDFVLVNGMYVASRLRSVGIVDDTLVEGDETFELRLLLAGGVSRFFTLGAGNGQAEVTIVDNDTGSAPTSEPATVAPLTGFELVDATAHLDAGAVEDGATLTGIDPAKLYGFRANVASGAELKSVRLELSGPGPDDRVARTDNGEPYALYADSEGHEHGAALAAGSYTLTATAHSEKDGGGSELGTLSVEFTVAGEPLTARFEGLPEGTHGGAGETFSLRLSFSEAVSTTPEALRDHALEVTNATVEAVSRVDDRSDLWEVRLTPESDAMVTVSLLPAADCDAAGAVCTEDGRMLSGGVARVILGPPPNSPATGQPTISGTAQVGQTLTADTSGIVDEDGLDNVTFSYQWMAGDANIQGATGSSYTLADRDKGKTIKVIVSFTDDANNEESLPSAATDAVAALPGKPQDLKGEASAQRIELTWKAPTGSAVVEYVVYRGILQNGSMNGQALSKYATIDAAGKAMTYTDDNVEEGVEYRYRVAAVNSDGEGKKSTWLDIRAE